MLPVIAIVGRPNVGKSTLFNALTRSRDALVVDFPGVTRDRQYGRMLEEEQTYIIVDTGGIVDAPESEIENLLAEQTQLAVDEADLLLFLVDARDGLTATDQRIADALRRTSTPIILVANKIDGLDEDLVLSDFYRLGFKHFCSISAAARRGIQQLTANVLTLLPQSEETEEEDLDDIDGIRVAFMGQPNAGKSTLINRILGEERVIVSDRPGTTRDRIAIPFKQFKHSYVLIDTAGIRRRGKIHEIVEKFSAIKSIQALEITHVVILMIDARKGLGEQDIRLIRMVIEAGKALVIAINKWDGMRHEARERIRREIDRRLSFADFARVHFISALHGTGVGNLFDSIQEGYRSAMKQFSTPHLTELLAQATQAHAPPRAGISSPKLRYAHMGGHNPPIIVIHGKKTDKLSNTYLRYLNAFFRKALKLYGTPLRLQFKSDANPFAKKG